MIIIKTISAFKTKIYLLIIFKRKNLLKFII